MLIPANQHSSPLNSCPWDVTLLAGTLFPSLLLQEATTSLAEATNPLPLGLNLSQGSPQGRQTSPEPESQLSQCLLLGL